jgi:hypothetical protein
VTTKLVARHWPLRNISRSQNEARCFKAEDVEKRGYDISLRSETEICYAVASDGQRVAGGPLSVLPKRGISDTVVLVKRDKIHGHFWKGSGL